MIDISTAANIAEIGGGIAILVSLVYVAIQIRQSSATARAQTRQALADSQINYLNSRVTDPFLRDISFKMYAGKNLDDAETMALRLHVTAHIRLFENYFTQYALGTMDAEDWRAMRAVIGNHFRLEPYRHVFTVREEVWNSEFAVEVNRILGEIDAQIA